MNTKIHSSGCAVPGKDFDQNIIRIQQYPGSRRNMASTSDHGGPNGWGSAFNFFNEKQFRFSTRIGARAENAGRKDLGVIDHEQVAAVKIFWERMNLSMLQNA